jgi:plasmid stabilization system protein ParE
MTRYTVTATHKAESDLAELWLRAFDRASVTVAADRIDQILREDAPRRGCTATHGLRQLIVAPLIADFTVEEDDRRVTIWAIRHIGELTNGH